MAAMEEDVSHSDIRYYTTYNSSRTKCSTYPVSKALLLLILILALSFSCASAALPALHLGLVYAADEYAQAAAALAAVAELKEGVSYVHPLFYRRNALVDVSNAAAASDKEVEDAITKLDVDAKLRVVDVQAAGHTDAYRAASDAIAKLDASATRLLVAVLPPHLATAAALAAEQLGIPALTCSPGAASVGVAGAGLALPSPVAKWEGEALEELARNALCWRSTMVVHSPDVYAQGVVDAFITSGRRRPPDVRVRILANVTLASITGADIVAKQIKRDGYSRVVVALHDEALTRAFVNALRENGVDGAPYAYLLASRTADVLRAYGYAPRGAVGLDAIDRLPDGIITNLKAEEAEDRDKKRGRAQARTLVSRTCFPSKMNA